MTDTPTNEFDAQRDIRRPWRRFSDEQAPLRPELFEFCLKLTGNVWDAEDLCQDTLMRVFSALGKTDADISSPKAYLVRTASNLWVDTIRKSARQLAHHELQEGSTEDAAEASLTAERAAHDLLSGLYPQERAALVMKDVLGYSLAETAAALNTTSGAVKSALHRARSRLHKGSKPRAGFAPDRTIVERFMRALRAADLDTLKAICASDLRVELVGGVESASFEESRNFFAHAHMVMPELGFGEGPRWELSEYLGEPLVLGFRTLDDVEGLNEIHRIEVVGDKISKIRCYCFCPDVLAAVGRDLGFNALARPYRSPSIDDY